MKYNGEEIEVTCTLENDTIKITIIDSDNLNFPFTNINGVAEFLATVYRGIKYRGIKEEALIALKNLLQDTDVSQDTVQTETKTKESNHQDPINKIESGNFNGITAKELLRYFKHVYKSKYDEEYIVNYNDKKFLEENIKRFGVEETVCRIDKLIYNYETINGGNSRFPRPYVRQLDIHAKNPWISEKLQNMERVVKINGITAYELLRYFRHVYKSKYNENYTVCRDDKKILEENIKRFGVEETVCRIDKLIYNYETINGGNSNFPRPYVKQLDIHAKNPWISEKLQNMERVVKNTSFTNEKDREDRCIEIKKECKMNMKTTEMCQ